METKNTDRYKELLYGIDHAEDTKFIPHLLSSLLFLFVCWLIGMLFNIDYWMLFSILCFLSTLWHSRKLKKWWTQLVQESEKREQRINELEKRIEELS